MQADAASMAFNRDWATADGFSAGHDGMAKAQDGRPDGLQLIQGLSTKNTLAEMFEEANAKALEYKQTHFEIIGQHSELELQLTSMGEGFTRGFTSATVGAALFGTGVKKAANEALKGLAAQSLVEAAFSTAKGLASLAFGDVASAGLFFQSAAVFGGIGALAAGAAQATGGLRSGGGSGGRGAGVGGATDFGRRPQADEQDRKMELTILMSSSHVMDSLISESDRRRGSSSARAVAVTGPV